MKTRPILEYKDILDFETFVERSKPFFKDMDDGIFAVGEIHGSDDRMDEDEYDPQYNDVGCFIKYDPTGFYTNTKEPHISTGNDYDEDPIDINHNLDIEKLKKPDAYMYLYNVYLDAMKEIIGIQRRKVNPDTPHLYDDLFNMGTNTVETKKDDFWII